MKALITGASSGIGKAIAKKLSLHIYSSIYFSKEILKQHHK